MKTVRLTIRVPAKVAVGLKHEAVDSITTVNQIVNRALVNRHRVRRTSRREG